MFLENMIEDVFKFINEFYKGCNKLPTNIEIKNKLESNNWLER